MLYSMTGFGRAEYQDSEKKISVEIKSVNHRYFECSIRLPRKFQSFEADLRHILKEYASRGKLDVYVNYEDHRLSGTVLQYNAALAEQYVQCAKEAEREFTLLNDLTVTKLLAFPDILKMEEEEPDENELWDTMEQVMREAAVCFRDARQKEGIVLRENLLSKLDDMEKRVQVIVEHEPQIMEAYKDRLREKTKELLENAQLEESRIAAEVVLYADKICTDEETVRLLSHIRQVRDTIEHGEGVGRKLDFLAQEMNREANTILSKAGDMLTSDLGVALKTDIEKIREQIQNIE
ncbi:MAG: YicC family protein [Eubacterium sp.]|nr:YicC family protein [Eubacterium sp.]